MPKTTVGLFEHFGLVGDVVREIEALGFPRNEVRNLKEPAAFEVTGGDELSPSRFRSRRGQGAYQDRGNPSGGAGLRPRTATRRSPGFRDRFGRKGGCRCGSHEPARRGGDRRDQWPRTAVNRHGSREHDSATRQSGHDWAASPVGRRRLPFCLVTKRNCCRPRTRGVSAAICRMSHGMRRNRSGKKERKKARKEGT